MAAAGCADLVRVFMYEPLLVGTIGRDVIRYLRNMKKELTRMLNGARSTYD